MVFLSILNKYKFHIIIILLIILAIRGINSLFNNNTYNVNNIEAITDSLNTIRDENGKLKSEIKVITMNNYKEFTKLKIENSELLRRLQLTVKQNKGGSAIVGKTTTTVHDNLTVNENKFFFKDKWIDLNGETYPKPFFDLKVYNEPAISLHKEDNKVVATWTDENPYTEVKDMRAYMDLPKEKDKSQGFGIGIQYDIINQGPSIGIGYYKIILPVKLF